jgi:L-asparaginase/Glu-tRNA(Gln) amidotransferase subunit D
MHYTEQSKKTAHFKKDAFRPVNEKPIAKIFEDKIEMISDKYNIKDKKKKKTQTLLLTTK